MSGGATYTQLALAAVPLTVAVDVLVLRSRVLARRSFWAAYAIVLVFQLLTNGALTGFEIVRYDPRTIVGWRFAGAPVEDLLFPVAHERVASRTRSRVKRPKL